MQLEYPLVHFFLLVGAVVGLRMSHSEMADRLRKKSESTHTEKTQPKASAPYRS